MEQRHLLFTFDHELFLGRRSGSVEHCMIRPVDRVLPILERHGLAMTFFVDTTFLLELERRSSTHVRCRADLDRIARQLRELVERGHHVYPHIHPHWADAVYDEVRHEWDLQELRRYRLSALDDAARVALFDGSVGLLRRMLAPVAPAYRVSAYRAGGWCIQPFADFRPHFLRCGIDRDMSVLAGMRRHSNAVDYDFTAPLPGPVYRFADDVMRPDPAGPFTEVTISSIPARPRGPVGALVDKVLWRIAYGRQMGDGQGVAFVDVPGPDGSMGTRDREMVAIELLTVMRYRAYADLIDRTPFVQFISHPKMISRHNLHMLERLLDRCAARYRLSSDLEALVSRSAGAAA
ncbi:MAG: hypothetical protein IT228_03820 [Flavobacteriales bacterium]|nr:hypothetical protein [Flavobacteriales bacterium]MCC6576449.1 hypothetical protein [Flavobacteriales bacterium]NUQ16057.1 hypothetical protein [Flavobacteriales bacterium]